MPWAAKKVNHVVYVLVVLACLSVASATVFQVGGSQGWAVPKNPTTNTYNEWAEKNRFRVGDSLVFVYQSGSDSVLQVSQDDYNNCNTAAPIATFNDGRTTFTFNRSGAFYFISGVADNCKNNEKLVVVVLGDRTKQTPAPVNNPPTAFPSEQAPSYNGVSSSKVAKMAAFFGALLSPSILAVL